MSSDLTKGRNLYVQDNTQQEKLLARNQVTMYAYDEDEAQTLLDMLGLGDTASEELRHD